MNQAQLIAHFDRISEAAGAIPRLRRFIIDLAVRGKLIEQDQHDEPASKLLKRIQREKATLTHEGDIRKHDQLRPIEDDQVPFPSPIGWSWTHLADISKKLHYGFTASADHSITSVRLLRITDIQNNSVNWDSVPGCDISNEELAQYRLEQGDILIARTGGTIGKTFLIRETPVDAVFASYLIRAQVSFEIFQPYLKFFLESSAYWEQLQAGSRGTGQPNVNGKTLGRIKVAIPPNAEQHRIVAKVGELMTLCDRLEAAQTERENRRNRLTGASLHQLNSNTGAGSFREHANFFLKTFQHLAARPEQVRKIRQTVLTLAIRGQLVPQSPDDQPAGQLLGQRVLNLSGDDAPWELPVGWSWSSFHLIGDTLGGGTPSKTVPEFWRGAIPWVSPKDMKVDLITEAQDHISESAIENSAARLIPTRALLMVVRGMILAHSFPAAITATAVAINQDMKAVIPFQADLVDFLLLLTKGLKPEILRLVQHSTHGTCKLLTEDLFSLPIPIPPFAEQLRILAKVNTMMEVCDGLQDALVTTSQSRHRLLECLLHNTLENESTHMPTAEIASA
jgi:type I restriction enzyme S subunit